MKATDVIGQMWARLPVVSPNFTENVGILSISTVGVTATVTTAAVHNLVATETVTIDGVLVPVEIDTVTDDTPLNTLTITTLTDHDLTKNNKEVGIVVDAPITGSLTETFTVVRVDNRRTFTVTKGVGTPIAGDFLQEAFLSGYNGLQTVVSAPTTTTFTYTLTETLASTTVAGGTVSSKHRISGAVDFDTARLAYTEQSGESKLWAFVVVETSDPNKDRKGTNDATATRGQKQSAFQQVIETFTVYLFVPNKGDTKQHVGGVITRDLAIDERLPILQSVLGIQYDPDLSFAGQNKAAYDGDGYWAYDGAFYVHFFRFQQVVSITNPDTAVQVDSRAFRDINFTINSLGIQADTDDMTADVDLDDIPLP